MVCATNVYGGLSPEAKAACPPMCVCGDPYCDGTCELVVGFVRGEEVEAPEEGIRSISQPHPKVATFVFVDRFSKIN